VHTRTAPRIAAAALLVAATSIASMHAQAIAIAAIHGYQRSLAPVIARAGARCRFTPTCSRYAETVMARDGVVRGGWKTLKRIARCGPWTPFGTVDVP
jgi:putative membrane protein insertion efficiency factor